MSTIMENTPTAWGARAQRASSWEAAGWTREGQEDRFRAVIAALDPEPGSCLLDYGCGTGRLSEFLPITVAYFAYDWANEMRERCRREHPRAFVFDYPPEGARFDYVVAVGTFNLADKWSKEKTGKAIETLWGRTLKTLVVSLYAGDDPRCLSYTTADAMKFAHGLPGRTVPPHMDGGYRPNDLLLVVRR